MLSTRGWFDSANEISAILATLLPINIYFLFKENRINNYLLYTIQVISMIILGTRVSTYCAILISFLFIIINIFSKFIRKEKINYKFIIIAVISCLYYFLSPVGNYYLKNSEQYFASFVFIGLTAWEFFNRMINGSVKLIINNRDLVTKVYIPKYIFPLSRVLSSFVNLLFALVAVIILMIFMK